MLIRWSLWGAGEPELLNASVRTFYRFFGESPKYLVFTDRWRQLRQLLPSFVDIREYPAACAMEYAVWSGPTWAKWCPAARLVPGEVEVHVDSDIFVVSEPREVFELCDDSSSWNYAVMEEANGAHWQRGCFHARIDQRMPFINAGFLMQSSTADISKALRREFAWWKKTNTENLPSFHDEQGAVTSALLPAFRSDRLRLLPKHRYMIISPRSNADVETLEGIAMLHATHPHHPAYHKFSAIIRGLQG